MKRYITNKEMQITNKHMKRSSTSLANREMKIKPYLDNTTHLS